MHFIRNILIPAVATAVGALVGLVIIGLPGVNMIQTLDGSPVPGGIPVEQVGAIIADGKRIGSYVDFYGVSLPGEPLYWAIGTMAVMAFAGYRIGALTKVKAGR